jgi:hypothetical protein
MITLPTLLTYEDFRMKHLAVFPTDPEKRIKASYRRCVRAFKKVFPAAEGNAR